MIAIKTAIVPRYVPRYNFKKLSIMRLTSLQVANQQETFDAFMLSANLKKIGERYLYFMLNNAEDGMYTPYVYILRVLSMTAKVNGCMYHPITGKFYNQILLTNALDIYLTSLQSKD